MDILQGLIKFAAPRYDLSHIQAIEIEPSQGSGPAPIEVSGQRGLVQPFGFESVNTRRKPFQVLCYTGRENAGGNGLADRSSKMRGLR